MFRQTIRTLGQVRFNSLSTFSRYAAQLEAKAKAVGAASVEELKVKLAPQIEAHKQSFDKMDPLRELMEYESRMESERNASKPLQPHGAAADATPEGAKPRAASVPRASLLKTLSTYVDVEKLSALESHEIEFIWRSRFTSDDLVAVVPVPIWRSIYTRARKHPLFILPLPRAEGTELHYVQWGIVGDFTTQLMITSLGDYKLRGECARAHTTVTFHQELGEKGVVLMNGAALGIASADSQILLMSVQRFYGGADAEDKAAGAVVTEAGKRRHQLLAQFNSGSDEFSLERLIEEAGSLEP